MPPFMNRPRWLSTERSCRHARRRGSRVKPAKPSLVENPHELPEYAIRFCLDDVGLEASDIDRAAYSFDPELRRAEYQPEWWPDGGMEAQFLRCLGAACSMLLRDEGAQIALG